MLAWLQVLGGFVVLMVAAEGVVRGASSIARALGVSTMVVGMTVVAYGTSAPEAAVSVAAALRGTTGVALGNVIGSNIANLGLVLGAAALVHPLEAHASLLKREVPFLIVSAALIPALAYNGDLDRGDGIVMLLGAALFTSVCVWRAISESIAGRRAQSNEKRTAIDYLRDSALIVVGFVGLGLGGDLLVRGAVTIATEVGVSERVIGLTVIAVGTSLPELATSMVSAARGEMDMAVGNVIGSNIFNVFFVLGGAAAVRPLAVTGDLFSFDVIVMLALSLAMVPMVVTGERVSRAEGAVLLATFIAFIVGALL